MRMLALVLLVPLLMSLGTAEQASWTGLVVVRGNAPFTYLTLADESGRLWRLKGDVASLSREAQGQRVQVTGHIEGTQGTESIVVESWAWAPEEKP